MIDEFPARIERRSTYSSPTSNSTTPTIHPPGRMTGLSPTRTERTLISESSRISEEYSPFFQPPPTSTPYTTMTTITSSSENATDASRPYSINDRLIYGNEETSMNGWEGQLLPIWTGIENTQTYPDMNSYHLSHSSMNITSRTAPVTSMPLTPSITEYAEESWLDGATPSCSPCGGEILTPTCYHKENEDALGPLQGGLWDSTSSPLPAPNDLLETTLIPTDTCSRYHRVNHEWVSQTEIETEAEVASPVVYEGPMLTQEDIELAIREMAGEGDNGGEETIELLLQDDLEDPCDGQRTSICPQTPVPTTMTTDHRHPRELSPTITTTVTTVEEGGSEMGVLEWSSVTLGEENSTELTWNARGRKTTTMWKEGFERARRNLSSNFNIPEAYSLGKLIVEDERQQVSQFALKYLGEYYRRIVKKVYLLHKGCEGQWETSLKPRAYYRLPTKEIHRWNIEKRSAQEISSE